MQLTKQTRLMKSKEEIEKLANELIGVTFCGHINITDEVKEFYINGYKQCQEDLNKDLYSEIENLIITWSNDGTKTAGTLTRQIMEKINNY